MTAFDPRLDILPPAQLALWPELEPAAGMGFCLYGGTAIALRLGHRTSVDFDFFSAEDIDEAEVRSRFTFAGRATIVSQTRNTIHMIVPTPTDGDETVKLSFFGGIGFGHIGRPEVTRDCVLTVASLDDLMALKLTVVMNRIELRDYLDIAAMIRAGVSVAKGLATARAFYGGQFQPSVSLKAMTYFQDAELADLSPTDRDTLIRAAGAVGDLPSVSIIPGSLVAAV